MLVHLASFETKFLVDEKDVTNRSFARETDVLLQFSEDGQCHIYLQKEKLPMRIAELDNWQDIFSILGYQLDAAMNNGSQGACGDGLGPIIANLLRAKGAVDARRKVGCALRHSAPVSERLG